MCIAPEALTMEQARVRRLYFLVNVHRSFVTWEAKAHDKAFRELMGAKTRAANEHNTVTLLRGIRDPSNPEQTRLAALTVLMVQNYFGDIFRTDLPVDFLLDDRDKVYDPRMRS